MPPRNVFIIGLEPFQRERLRSLRDADELVFHGLLLGVELEPAPEAA